MNNNDPAQALLDLKNHATPRQAWGTREVLFVLLAIALVAAILFLWAAYIRKPKRRESSDDEVVATASLKTARHRRRRRSRKFKRRNPTLAETGGLPPRKQECNVPDSSS